MSISRRFDWQGWLGGFLQGTSPVCAHHPLFHFLRHMCPPFPLGQTLTRQWSDETEVSPVFVLIGMRQYSPDICTHIESHQLSPLKQRQKSLELIFLYPQLQREFCLLDSIFKSVFICRLKMRARESERVFCI